MAVTAQSNMTYILPGQLRNFQSLLTQAGNEAAQFQFS